MSTMPLPNTTAPIMPERQAYSVEEVAKALGISRTSAYLATLHGEIPSIVIGRRRLVPRAALDRLLSGEHRQVPAK